MKLLIEYGALALGLAVIVYAVFVPIGGDINAILARVVEVLQCAR